MNVVLRADSVRARRAAQKQRVRRIGNLPKQGGIFDVLREYRLRAAGAQPFQQLPRAELSDIAQLLKGLLPRQFANARIHARQHRLRAAVGVQQCLLLPPGQGMRALQRQPVYLFVGISAHKNSCQYPLLL